MIIGVFKRAGTAGYYPKKPFALQTSFALNTCVFRLTPVTRYNYELIVPYQFVKVYVTKHTGRTLMTIAKKGLIPLGKDRGSKKSPSLTNNEVSETMTPPRLRSK